MAEPKRLAIVGVENTHAGEIVQYLNNTAAATARVTALVAGQVGEADAVAALGNVPTIVSDPLEVLDQVDALVVTNRDGALHRRFAEAYLQAGKPVWVDKPLAASTEDAQAMLELAERTGTPITSYSALRWAGDTDAGIAAAKTIGPIQAVTVTGPAEADSPYSGIFFYGIHAADVAQRVTGGEAAEIHARKNRESVLVDYRVGEIPVRLQLVHPDAEGRVPFHLEILGTHGMVSRPITLGEDYVVPGIEVFERMLATGTEPISHDQLIQPIRTLEQVNRQI